MLKMNITYTTQEELDELLTLLSQQYEEVMLAKKTKKQKKNEVTVVAKGIKQVIPMFRAPFLPK